MPIDKNDVEIGSKIDNFLMETVEDIENGVYQGWFMIADITERDMGTKMLFNYVSITSSHIEFSKGSTEKPYLKFKTLNIHFYCKELEYVCTALEYLSTNINNKISYEA